MIGAQYMITGGFMSDGRGNFVLTGRTINVETSTDWNARSCTKSVGVPSNDTASTW